MNKNVPANLAAVVAALCAGTSVVVTRLAVGEIDPITLAFYRYVVAAVCLVPLLPFVWPKARLLVADIIKIALLGVVFFGFFPWVFSAALQYTSAARGAIGVATIPIQTLIVAALFGHEQVTSRKIISVALAFTGIVVVFGPEAYGGKVSSSLMGDGLMLLGAFCAAIYSVFGRPVFGKYGPMFVMVLAVVFGVLALLPLAFASGRLTHWPRFSREGWLAVIFLGTVCAAIQFSLFTWALRWLPPSRTVIYLTLNPIAAILLARVMLGEVVTPVLIVGLAFVIAGIFVANWRDADNDVPVKIGTIQQE
jgi:drug/metabolite transporter (DMT)-like permease